MITLQIRDPDPVIFLEPTRSYRLMKEEVEDDAFLSIPVEKARIVQEGNDVTVIGSGVLIDALRSSMPSMH